MALMPVAALLAMVELVTVSLVTLPCGIGVDAVLALSADGDVIQGGGGVVQRAPGPHHGLRLVLPP